MEKYSQFRDKGTGIAPFLPVPSTSSGVYLPLRVLLFAFRLPILLFVALAYFFVFCWLPIGSLGKKAALWLILAVPGIWWVDLQVDGVRRGSLGNKSSLSRLPRPSSVIVSSFTSPIDTLYLAAIFDPVFTISYPNSRLLQRTTLFHSIIRGLLPPQLRPPYSASRGDRISDDGRPSLVTLAELTRAHPKRVICILPECTTTNGRGILPLSPCLLTASSDCKIFPTSLRYTPPDVTTPVPGWRESIRFFWNLCSSPTHTIRVRIAEAVYNTSLPADGNVSPKADQEDDEESNDDDKDSASADEFTAEERRVMDKVGEALARLGRVKRVGLGVRDKVEFLKMWNKRRS